MNRKVKKIFYIIMIMVGVITLSACECKEDTSRNGYDYLVLVNKYSALPDDWEDKVELVDAKNAWDEDIKLEKEAYEQYKKLEKELKDEGVIIELDSVYRSVKDQQALWDDWSNDPTKGIDYVKKFVAVPGFSEHHTGLAIDICIRKDGELIDDNDDMIAEREIFSKIHEKLSKYGFILRYLENREDSTGYTYEPWHLRYVGSKKIAKEIMDNNMTFEEYLESIEDVKGTESAAKIKIEKALQDYFKDIYGDKISNSRFNIKKIYSEEDEKNNEILDSYKLGKKDIAFEVTYQIQPSDEKYIEELTMTSGNYDEVLGWIKDISRLGILRYNDSDKSYRIENFGTGW